MKPLPKLKKCMGPSCMGCSSSMCMAEGGRVGSGKNRSDFEQGIHPVRKLTGGGGSEAGASIRRGRLEEAKEDHETVRDEMKSMDKPRLYARGGEVEDMDEEDDKREQEKRWAEDDEHELGVLKAHFGPGEFAQGGEVDEMGEDESLQHGVVEELLKGFETKNKKEILEAFRALVLSCKGE